MTHAVREEEEAEEAGLAPHNQALSFIDVGSEPARRRARHRARQCPQMNQKCSLILNSLYA